MCCLEVDIDLVHGASWTQWTKRCVVSLVCRAVIAINHFFSPAIVLRCIRVYLVVKRKEREDEEEEREGGETGG